MISCPLRFPDFGNLWMVGILRKKGVWLNEAQIADTAGKCRKGLH
jgi:hypothetical protein